MDHDPIPLSRFDYDLPEELIAQQPVEPRDSSRLLVVNRAQDSLDDHVFSQLPDLLRSGDLLVVNDTRVRHARLHGRRASGGRVEFLALQRVDDHFWECLARPSRRLSVGEAITLLDRNGELSQSQVVVEERLEGAIVVSGLSEELIDQIGEVPLPPYIHRNIADPERYQTIYRNEAGSAAAPTAGLHFTTELLGRCQVAGIGLARLTLHVGLDTFRPVTEEDARNHRIHSEWCRVPSDTIERVRQAKAHGGRVVAVGTTVVRALESAARADFPLSGYSGWTDLYITPPFEFRAVDCLITNFHLPRSTLLLLVAAFAGESLMWRAYEHAIGERYRFYSFGDAMLIL